MKKFAMSSLLALSSTLAVVGISQANVVDYSTAKASTMQQENVKGKDLRHHDGHKGFGKQRGVMAQLDLTEAQQQQIDTIKQAQRTKRQSERAAHQAERQQYRARMQTLMNSKTLNTAALNSLANEHAEQAKERFIEQAQTKHAIAQVLTAEQRAQLEQLHEQRGERAGHGERPMGKRDMGL